MAYDGFVVLCSAKCRQSYITIAWPAEKPTPRFRAKPISIGKLSKSEQVAKLNLRVENSSPEAKPWQTPAELFVDDTPNGLLPGSTFRTGDGHP